MKKIKYLILVTLMAAGINANAKPVVGDAAPEFSAVDINGKVFNLTDYKDKTVVLEWNNPECPFVHKHYVSGNMQGLQKKYTEKGIVWVTINSSAEGKQGYFENNEVATKSFAEKGLASSNYIRDTDGKIGQMYGAATTPHMFIIDKGTLVYQGAIDSIPTGDKADIVKADNYVQKALDEVLAGKPVTTAVTQSYAAR